MAFSVLLVDDHKIMRDGIKAILRGSQEFCVMGEAETGLEAIEICKKQQPQIVLMGIVLPGINGIETTAAELRRLHPGIKVIILSMYDDEHSVVSAIRSGARAFVVKNASASDLIDALKAVAAGGSYLSPKVSERIMRRVRSGAVEGVNESGNALEALAPREQQILRLIAGGKSSKEIAADLDIAVETVRSYRKTLMRKLDVKNVAELTQLAVACGITHFPVPPSNKKPPVHGQFEH